MNHKGFTLMELLIGISIFSVIMVGLYPVFSQITTFNQENYVKTMLLDNSRAGIERIERELRDACFLYKPGTPLIYNEPMEDDVCYDTIVFSHRNSQEPDQNEYVRFRLEEAEDTLMVFPNCKYLVREVWNDEVGDWINKSYITEPIIKDLIFKKQGQIVKICIVSYVKIRLNKEPQEYIFLNNIALRNNLIVGGCAP